MVGNHNRIEHSLLKKYEPISRMVLRQYFKHEGANKGLYEYLHSLNYKLFKKKSSIDAITYNPKTKVLVNKKRGKHFIFRVLLLDDKQYIYLKKHGHTFLLEDKNQLDGNSNIYIILVFAIILISLILSFIITLRKLMPLKILKDKVSTLGDENFDFECCNMDGKDEVSLLAMEFKNSAKKLKDIKEARNVFIRNIMHELKTPIAKGRFLTQIQRNEQNDEKLKEVFISLESLINEFASIEELISSNKNIEKRYYFLDDICDNAKDILMIEDEKVQLCYENKKLEVNFKLFSIAVKNLIDNAIKYSDDKKVTIKSENEDIIFENSGKKLKYKLEEYYEPFFAKEDKTNNSFGLGLYIIHNILKANDYTLEYEYKNALNIFRCRKNNISKS